MSWNIVRDLCSTTKKNLRLEVVSWLKDANPKAAIPLLSALEQTQLVGFFRFCIEKKIVGVHGIPPSVKIMGINNGPRFGVLIKAQHSPEYCYQGFLQYVEGPAAFLPSAMIHDMLKGVTGTKWYNPKDSSTRHVPVEQPTPSPKVPRSTTPTIQKPPMPALVVPVISPTVSTPVMSTPPTETIPAPVNRAQEPEMPVPLPGKVMEPTQYTVTPKPRGVTDDRPLVEKIFKRMAGIAQNNQIDSERISELIIELVYGGDNKKDRRCCGPVITSWVRSEFLERVSETGKYTRPVIYLITSKARKEFCLEEDSVVIKGEDLVKNHDDNGVVKDTANDSQLLETVRNIQRQAEKYNTARSDSDEITMKILNLEEEIRKLRLKLAELEPILQDAGLKQVFTLWCQLKTASSADPGAGK